MLKKYLKHSPALFLSLFFYGAIYFLLQNLYPSFLSYIFLGLLFWGANLFALSFLFLNTRRGVWGSLFLELLLLAKLQKIIFDFKYFLGLLFFFVFLELAFVIIRRIRSISSRQKSLRDI